MTGFLQILNITWQGGRLIGIFCNKFNLNHFIKLWLKHEIQMMTKHLVFFYRCTRKLTWWTASKPLTEAGRCPPSNYILHWPQNSSNVSPQDCFTDANSHCKYRLIIKRHVILLYIPSFHLCTTPMKICSMLSNYSPT